MDSLISVLAILLMAVAVGPLLLLGLYMLADLLGLKIADRILEGVLALLTLQWRTGSVLNLLGGLAIAALGAWMAWRLGTPATRFAGALLVPFGLWRAYRGGGMLTRPCARSESFRSKQEGR
ncbi:hypothetical protein [Variovorax ginsengisoli]|uniref:Uncharacterized protein n=1 Tax=Variovorax ginsengisoli TaxID=363844 RepID=A0ABT9S8T0_9BURK|nr:hypothetical protein [Variovorax ginsengisoli]MDP9900760.1 hypothetical protein [Variovorax ginsengisoli]